MEAVVVSLITAILVEEDARRLNRKACVDTLDEKSQYTCLQFACLGLCPKSFVRDACRYLRHLRCSAGKHGYAVSKSGSFNDMKTLLLWVCANREYVQDYKFRVSVALLVHWQDLASEA